MFEINVSFKNLASARVFAKGLKNYKIHKFQYKLDFADDDEPTLKFTILAESSSSIEDLTFIAFIHNLKALANNSNQ